MKRWKLCNALAEIESDDGDWVRYDDAAARIRDLEAQVAAANRQTKEIMSRMSKSLKREEQTGAALVAMVEASSALAESIEAAVPGLRDNHETSVMEAFVRMMEAQQAAVSAMDGSVEAFQVVRDDGMREMLRLIELANAERDAARADVQRERDKLKVECEGCAKTAALTAEIERLREEKSIMKGRWCNSDADKIRLTLENGKLRDDLAALRARVSDPGGWSGWQRRYGRSVTASPQRK